MAALVNTSGKATASATTTVTTGAVTPSGSDTAVLVFTIGESSGYANACNYTNSGGTAINDFTGADVHLGVLSNFRQAYAKAFGEIASPTSSTTVYTGFPAGFNVAVSIAVFLEDADQTDPFGTPDVSAETGGVGTRSVSFTGLDVGQLVVGALFIQDFAGTPSTATVDSGTTLIDSQVSADEENAVCTIYAVEGTADGSGNCTLSMTVSSNGAAGTMARMYAVPIIGATGGGGTEHPSTGALVADSATVSGTATHLNQHPSTGSLVAQSATVAGAATHLALHASTGELAAQAATVSGTATRFRAHPSTGALAAQVATVAGTAARFRAFASSGDLAAQAATMAGDATVTPAAGPHLTTGALSAQEATVSGIAEVTHIAPIIIFDGHDGGKEPKKRKEPDFKQYQEAKARLRKQIEAAFPNEEPEEVQEVKKQAEVVLAQTVKKHDIAKAMETIRMLQEALEYAQDEEDLLNILL